MPQLLEISGLGQETERRGPSFGEILSWGWIALGIGVTIGSLVSRYRAHPGLGDLGIIKPCRTQDLTSRKPRRDQRWCLWDSKGKRILGRHPSRSGAMRQERLIQMKKRGLLP